MKFISTIWPLIIILILASLSFGRLLENDNVLADRSLSDLVAPGQFQR